MRLNNEQVQTIKQAAQQVLGDGVRVILFGSRTNDDLSGGDIDLLFETPRQLDDRVATTGRLYASLIRGAANPTCELFYNTIAAVEAELKRLGVSA